MSTLPPMPPAEARKPFLRWTGPLDLRPPPPQQVILLAVLAIELLVFSIIGTNFLTWHNAFDVLRVSVELGLLALALTPVIVTGGIDLSVGSLLGLTAVLFGKMWRDAGLPIWVAAGAAVAIGAMAGSLNGLLITRLRIPALIVTLGSFSLFRGLAEGITGGVDNITNFPRSFVALGQGAQVAVFVIAGLGFWLLLHRTTVGRALSAIGYSAEGARYAGIPVERRITLTYVLAGACAAIAAMVYVAHVGQAKADAGSGYELDAIAAVVLGGTSIFGGRGSIGGTLLGLFAIAILKNGLQLSDKPTESAAVLTGVLLLVAIGLDRKPFGRASSRSSAAAVAGDGSGLEELNMRNSQLAVLSIVILAAAFIVTGGNFLLVQSMQHELTGARTPSATSRQATGDPAPPPGTAVKPITIAVMPKSKGNAYFIACKSGAEEAARERGIKMIWDGPTDPDPARQNEIIETWLTRGVDVIAVAVENRGAISSVLRKAREKGIKVVTWDSDAEPDARDFFVNQATPQGIGDTLMDTAGQLMGGKGQFAIITASLTAANMNEWQKYIELRRSSNYPDIQMVALRPCDDLQPKAFDEAKTLLNSKPDLKLIMAICSPAVPGAAEAVKQSGRRDVKVIGLGLPNDNKPYVHAGITDAVILWKTKDLGYLTVLAAADLANGTLKSGAKTIDAGRLGKIAIKESDIVLGKPFVFTKDNIDQFDF